MHQKHPPLARPALDHYARTDVALVGTTCAVIDPLLERWAQALNDEYRTLTVTGDHGAVAEDGWARTQVQSKRRMARPGGEPPFSERLAAPHYDLALVNGNHYPAARQLVFVDPAKAGTLERRREQLTQVLAVVLSPGAVGLPPWLAAHLAATGQQPPSFPLAELDRRALPLLRSFLGTRGRALNALLLVGGKSSRMGTAKAELVYRDGRPEGERLAALCRPLVREVYVSDSTGGEQRFGCPVLADRFVGMGPAGAILTALQHDPDAAWLVLACDLPLLEGRELEALVAARQPARYATAYRLPGQPFPEPLVAIYEPRAYPRLLQFLALGYACPRKLLINSDVALLEAADARPFTNANTPEERRAALRILNPAKA